MNKLLYLVILLSLSSCGFNCGYKPENYKEIARLSYELSCLENDLRPAKERIPYCVQESYKFLDRNDI